MLPQTRAFSLALALAGGLPFVSLAATAYAQAQPPAKARGGLIISQPTVSTNLPFAKQPLSFAIRLENSGDRVINAPGVDLVVPTDLLLDPPDLGLAQQLQPGEGLLRRWTLTAERPGTYPVQVRIRAEGAPERVITMPVVVAREPRELDTRGDRHPQVRTDAEGNLVFRNEHVVAVLQKSEPGYGPILLYPATRTSNVRSTPVGMVPFIAQVGTGDVLFQPTEAEIAGDDRVRMRGTVTDGSTSWETEAEIWIPNEPWLSWEVRARTGAAATLGRLRPMPLYAIGEGPRQALFPGVEWVDGVQPAPLRTPDPYAVTVPFMAVTRDETTVGMLWDPRQKWGGAGYFQPTFGGDETGAGSIRMELAAPEVALPANRWARMEGKILVQPFESSPARAVRQWEKAFGAPIMEGFPRTFEATRKLAREAYTRTLWNPELNGWSPALDEEKALPPVQDAFPPLALLMDAGRSGARDRAPLQEQANRVIAELRKREPLDPLLAYRVGGVFSSLEAERQRLLPIVEDQLASGGWTWESVFPSSAGDQTRPGEPGETSLGMVTAQTLPILRHAALTGDSTMAGSGRKALEFIDRTFRVPRGAQTFGFPLRAPSVVAAAEAAECYLLGYQVTGEQRYVERARYWADAALTFIYFWGEKEKPALMHASRISYGSGSAGEEPAAQQWAGLNLARVLRALSDIRPDGLYDYVSEGIVASGMHQQFPSGPRAGLLPQSWDLRENRPEGLALAPRPLLEAMYPLDHLWTQPSHVRLRIGSDRMFAAGGAYLYRPWSSSTRVRLNLRWVEGQDTFLTLTGVPDKPLSVEYNTSRLRRQLDLPISRNFLPPANENEEPGWTYDPHTGVLILRLRHTGGEDHLEIRWSDPRERTPIERVDPKIRLRR